MDPQSQVAKQIVTPVIQPHVIYVQLVMLSTQLIIINAHNAHQDVPSVHLHQFVQLATLDLTL